MNEQDAKLVIDTPLGIYRLPSNQLPLAQTGTSLSTDELASTQIEISIVKASSDEVTKINDMAAQNILTVLQPPVSFEIEKVTNGNRTSMDRFNQYVERLIPLQTGTENNGTITGVVLNGNSLIPVPTRIVEQSNQKYAMISSLTNSTYALIKHIPELHDINGSWAASAIQNMAARLIIEGTDTGQFEPSRSITRAEFASVLARALGLKPGVASSSFNDVSLCLVWRSDFESRRISINYWL